LGFNNPALLGERKKVGGNFKKQQMQWFKRGAHLLLQTRTRVLNKELAEIFRVWYPNFQVKDEESEDAA
jgi:hypothetical protein